jgi:hypothetical protein
VKQTNIYVRYSKKYCRVLEFISSLKIDINDAFRVGRRTKICDIEVAALSLTSK